LDASEAKAPAVASCPPAKHGKFNGENDGKHVNLGYSLKFSDKPIFHDTVGTERERDIYI